jgi:hypothetical protein
MRRIDPRRGRGDPDVAHRVEELDLVAVGILEPDGVSRPLTLVVGDLDAFGLQPLAVGGEVFAPLHLERHPPQTRLAVGLVQDDPVMVGATSQVDGVTGLLGNLEHPQLGPGLDRLVQIRHIQCHVAHPPGSEALLGRGGRHPHASLTVCVPDFTTSLSRR